MILNIKKLSYDRKMIVSVYAKGEYIGRKLVESDVDLGKEDKPSFKMEIPECDEVKLVFSKRREDMISEPRFIDYILATLFTLITPFIPKLFPEQYFMNRLTVRNTVVNIKGNLNSEINMGAFDYKHPYISLDGEEIAVTYDYEELKSELDDEWIEYKSILVKRLISTLIVGAILVIDMFGALRVGYIGAFGVVLIPLAFINYIKLLLIGKAQKESFERGDM